ncbi:amyloid fiber anchoring/assembly protein TapA [Bacillus sp. NPDC077027]|uniref:amyloid fiber anchoring/assembly protein TapA n=1 Tax=Bacillus sp. NPDC077027 TaxID=3390548 RepID=UPI003D029F4F
MKHSLFVLFCMIILLSLAHLTTPTNASFNDFEFSKVTIKTCEDFHKTDKNCQRKKWDKGHLIIKDQTKIKGIVCAPYKLSITLKNIGQNMAYSGWRWELHKVPSVKRPITDGHVLERGSVPILRSKETIGITSNKAKTQGVYVFKIYYPEGFKVNGMKKAYVWSNPMALAHCIEKKMVPSESQSTQDTQKSKESQSSFQFKGGTVEDEKNSEHD